MIEQSIEEKNILIFIKDIILSNKLHFEVINRAKYHHNSSYKDAPSICEYGILSLKELNKLGINLYTDEILKKMNDIDSHINGNDTISLSVVGMTDLYKNEYEYNPFNPDNIDFLISDDIKAMRSTTHYGNEYLVRDKIDKENIKSIDIRLLDLIKTIEDKKTITTTRLEQIILKYNYLIDIAKKLNNNNLNIPIREMSLNNNFIIDSNYLKKCPKLILKKEDI